METVAGYYEMHSPWAQKAIDNMSNQGFEEVQWSVTTGGHVLRTTTSLSLSPWCSVTYETAVPEDVASRHDEFLAASFVHSDRPLTITVAKTWSAEDGPDISATLWNTSSSYVRIPPLPIVVLVPHYIHSSSQ